MTTTLNERERKAGATTWHADWLVSYGPSVEQLTGNAPDHQWRSSHTCLSVSRSDGSDLRIAQDPHYVVLFSGLLTNIDELHAGATQADAARIALPLVSTRGPDAFSSLRSVHGRARADPPRSIMQVTSSADGCRAIRTSAHARGRL